MRMTDTISFRVHKAIKNELNKLSDETDRNLNHIGKQAISEYLNRHQDAELHESVQKIMDQREELNDAYAEDYYIKKQNKMIQVKLKELTFLEFMDKNLAIVFMANKRHMSDEALNELLRQTLQSLKDRAYHHGFEDEWKNRLDDPSAYASEFLDHKSLEEKAFNDYITNM